MPRGVPKSGKRAPGAGRPPTVAADGYLALRLPADLLARLDDARGEESRSVWVRRAIEAALTPPR